MGYLIRYEQKKSRKERYVFFLCILILLILAAAVINARILDVRNVFNRYYTVSVSALESGSQMLCSGKSIRSALTAIFETLSSCG